MAARVVSLKRLRKEYQSLCKTPPTGVSVSLPSDSDLFVWEALFDGPEESPYKGGVFKARIVIGDNYPMKPPEVHFISPVPYHLNISQRSGQVCLGLLGDDKWEPAIMSLEHILQALLAILIRPEVTSAMDHDLLNNYHNFPDYYKSLAQRSAVTAARKFRL